VVTFVEKMTLFRLFSPRKKSPIPLFWDYRWKFTEIYRFVTKFFITEKNFFLFTLKVRWVEPTLYLEKWRTSEGVPDKADLGLHKKKNFSVTKNFVTNR
jgi:hypothetical protein